MTVVAEDLRNALDRAAKAAYLHAAEGDYAKAREAALAVVDLIRALKAAGG